MCVIDTILIIMQLCVGDLHNACNLRIMHNRQNQHKCYHMQNLHNIYNTRNLHNMRDQSNHVMLVLHAACSCKCPHSWVAPGGSNAALAEARGLNVLAGVCAC